MPTKFRLLPQLVVALLLVASNACSQQMRPPASNAPDSVFRYADLDQAWRAAQQAQRPVLVFVSMNRCAHCDRMERETYAHPQLARQINQRLVAVKLKREDAPDVVKQLGVRAFPTTLLISPRGEMLARVEGFADPRNLVKTFVPALAKRTPPTRRTAHATSRAKTQR